LHQVGDLFELNVKLRSQNVEDVINTQLNFYDVKGTLLNIRGSMHHDIICENDQQDATV